MKKDTSFEEIFANEEFEKQESKLNEFDLEIKNLTKVLKNEIRLKEKYKGLYE